MESLTTDTFFNGQIKVAQSRSGYRFSIDAVLLANHVMPEPEARILDLGTGCGIIPLILAFRHPGIDITGVDIQKELTDIASLNVRENDMENRVHIICEDLKQLKNNMVQGPFDCVVSNPPYRKAASGRMNHDKQRAVARHEIEATLSDVAEAASRMLRTSGNFFLIYPAQRLTDTLLIMRAVHLEPKRLRMVHSRTHTEAKLALIEGVKNGRPGLTVATPLVIYKNDKDYTDEVEGFFSTDV